jgi:hypothetical protein
VAQVIQILAALMILGAFVGVQTGRLEPTALRSLILNAVGAAILATLALSSEQWGFVLLEGVWALVAAWGLARACQTAVARRLQGRTSTGPGIRR